MEKEISNAKKITNNFKWIIICKLAQSLINLVISMLTARYLGPSNFGLINYAASLVTFFVPIMHLGLSSTLVKELVDDRNNEQTIVGTAITMCSIVSIGCIASIFLFSLFTSSGSSDRVIVCGLYSSLLLFQAVDIIQYWFFANYKAKYFSLTSLFAYFFVALYKFFLLATGKGVGWFAVSNSIDYLIIAILLVYFFCRLTKKKPTFSFATAKRLFKNSKYYILSDLMIVLFTQVDKVMLSFMIGDEATGLYSAAVYISGLSSFIFYAIVDSMRPIILEHKKNQDRKGYENSLVNLFSLIIYLGLAQSIFIAAFSPLLVNFLYGVEYSGAVIVLRVLIWYSTFSYIGTVKNVWILAEKKQSILWLVNSLGAFVNIALNLFLISFIGMVGAAIASLFSQFFTNIILGFVLPPLRGCNMIIIRSLRPKTFIDSLSTIYKRTKR